jgi:hypothetical protein
MTAPQVPSILCLGNCQAEALARALTRKGCAATYLRCLTTAFPPGRTARPLFTELAPFLPREELEKMFAEQAFLDITRREDLASVDCDAVLVSLFHEAALCRSAARDYPAFVNPARLAALDRHHPALAGHLRRSFAPLPLDHDAYPARFAAMLGQVRDMFPGRPILVLKRFSHHRAFGPTPHSYLHCWPEQGTGFDRLWREWTRTVADLRLLDLDRVLAEACPRAETLDAPFILYRLEARAASPSSPPSLDLEHLEDFVWDHAAHRFLAVLHGAAPADALPWQPPADWSREPAWWDCGPRAIAADAASGRTRKALIRVLAARENHFPILMEHEAAIEFTYKTLDFFQKALDRFTNPEALSWYAGVLCDSMREKLPGFSRNFAFLFAERALRLADHFQARLTPGDRRRLDEAAAPLLASAPPFGGGAAPGREAAA